MNAKEFYQSQGFNIDQIFEQLSSIPLSIPCWQLDDVNGFESDGQLSGGIQATGNYPGKAQNFEQMKSDLNVVLSEIPGKVKVNLHAIYRVSDKTIERNQIDVEHFNAWIDFAKEKNIGLDYNPTLFSHDKVKDNLTLSSPDKDIRDYWIEHCKRSRKIAEAFGKELKQKSLCNIWIPDGFKDNPGDRLGPRENLKNSLDEIFSEKVDNTYMDDSVESKVFGIGLESCTVGSHEFYLSYALKNNLLCLLDSGHFHPTESIADKISSLFLFFPKIALHLTRSVRWDSDHIVTYNDELISIVKELVSCNALDRTYIGLDYFDASVNRIAALILGARSVRKALLFALLQPSRKLKDLQDQAKFTDLLVMQEEVKNWPFEEIWDMYLDSQSVSKGAKWLEKVRGYETDVLSQR